MRKNKTLLRIFETELGSQTFKRKENIAFVVTIVIVILHLVGRGTTRRHASTGVANFATMRSYAIWGRRAVKCSVKCAKKASGGPIHFPFQEQIAIFGQTYTTVLWEYLDTYAITKNSAGRPVSKLTEIREGQSRLDQEKKRFLDY